jgi:hypothetical protein
MRAVAAWRRGGTLCRFMRFSTAPDVKMTWEWEKDRQEAGIQQSGEEKTGRMPVPLYQSKGLRLRGFTGWPSRVQAFTAIQEGSPIGWFVFAVATGASEFAALSDFPPPGAALAAPRPVGHRPALPDLLNHKRKEETPIKSKCSLRSVRLNHPRFFRVFRVFRG